MMDNSLLGDVLEIAHQAAHGSGFVTQDAVDTFTQVATEANQQNSLRRQGFSRPASKGKLSIIVNPENGFNAVLQKINALDDNKIQHVSRLAALDSIVNNAVNNAQHAADYTDPKQQMIAFITDYFAKTGNSDTAAAKIHETLGELLLRLVHTMHPTIYHTLSARTFEARLTEILENPDNLMARNANDPLRLNEQGKQAVADLFNEKHNEQDPHSGFIEQLAQGKATITPKHQMTVPLETQTELQNTTEIRKELKDVMAAWNEAVAEVKIPGVTDAHRQQMTISPERAEAIFDIRTWGQSADADGREKSSSKFLYRRIQNNLTPVDASTPKTAKQYEGKIYGGLTLDLRQNAKKVHLPYISSLIQVKLRNSENHRNGRVGRYEDAAQRQSESNGTSFADFCHDFIATREQKYEKRKEEANGAGLQWQGPEHSIFQQLDAFDPDHPEQTDDRSAFLDEIIRRNYKLIPDQLKIDTIAFNNGHDKTPKIVHSPDPGHSLTADSGGYELENAFLKRYEKEIRRAGLDPETIDYNEMVRVTIPHDINHPEGAHVSLRGAWDTVLKLNGWEFTHEGKQYSRLPTFALPEKPILDFWNYVNPEQILVQNFLMSTKKVEGSELVDISSDDRAIFSDTAKRLFVINDAINKYGSKVATRYQIANFADPADFLTLLKLFQDTGIAEIENGVVKSSKLAIQPLLETGEDLAAAPEIFKRLLADPIAKSFWKARGEAEVMLGFSDGAASVGNFASQWEIYQAAEKLTKLFAKEKIKVRFFQGRGRGVDRGGTIDPRLQMDLLPPEVAKHAYYDATIQSDLPMDLAISHAYGKDYFTKLMLGTMGAALTADEHIEQKKHLGEQAKGINWIMERSAKIYQDLVRTDLAEGALKIINNAADNPFKSSRVAIRGGVKVSKVFDDVRAISKEYLVNCMDMPMHNVGLMTALKEYKAEAGEENLKKLMEHPFFNAITQTIRTGIAHYDPTIAKAHAKVIGAEAFVDQVTSQLDGLSGMLDSITGKRYVVPTEASFGDMLDQVGHAVVIDGLGKGKPAHPVAGVDDQWMDTVFHSVFTNAQEVGHRELVYAKAPEKVAAAARA